MPDVRRHRPGERGHRRRLARGMGSRARPVRRQRTDTSGTRLMGALFSVGAVGFVVGPLDAYANRVGARGDALTYFIASILFTGGGLTQSWLAYPERRAHRAGVLAWRGAGSNRWGHSCSTSWPSRRSPTLPRMPTTPRSCRLPTRWARPAFSSPACCSTCPRRRSAGARRGGRRDGGSHR